jgi:hypothetical protein
MRKVILESPFAGNVNKNIRYARACVRDCVQKGDAPIASHLLYTQPGILNDDIPEERQLGIDSGLAWGTEAEATVLYVDLGVSNGMKYGIARAKKENRPIEERTIGTDWEKDPSFSDGLSEYDDILKEISFQRKHFSDEHDAKHTTTTWLMVMMIQLGNTAKYASFDHVKFMENTVKVAAVAVAALKSLKK